VLAGDETPLPKKARDELGEILLRLLHSFLFDSGEPRTESELRTFLKTWFLPMIQHQLQAHAKTSAAEQANLR
jgi:hypothetical protein